jgi:hypothetical protein
MSDRENHGKKEFFPLLEGKSNWNEWNQHLEVVLNAKHKSLLRVITGVDKRPEEIVAAASAIEAMIKEENASATQATHNTPSGRWDTASDSATRPPTSTFIAKSQRYQTEWDKENKMALAYLASTVNDEMSSRHIGAGKTAHEVYESLREVCEVGTPLSPCLKSIRWSTYKYEAGQSVAEFLTKWQYYLAELQQAYPINQQIPPLFCFHTFIAAVSNNPACIPWLNTVSLDGKGHRKIELDVLFKKFREAESRRLRLEREQTETSSASHTSAPRDDRFRAPSKTMTKGPSQAWCAIHKRLGHSTDDCFSNPRNNLNRRNKNRLNQSVSNRSKSQAPSSPLTQKQTPINSAEERTHHPYLSDEDDEPRGTDLLSMHPHKRLLVFYSC